MPMMPGNTVFKVRLFSFRTRREASAPALAPCLRPVCNDVAWLPPVKRSTNSRRFRRHVMDENRCARDIVFLSIMGITLNAPHSNKVVSIVNQYRLPLMSITNHFLQANLKAHRVLFLYLRQTREQLILVTV